MVTAKQLYFAYKESSYMSYLPAKLSDAESFINSHRGMCERESLTILIEYFYDWLLSNWEGEDLVV